MKQVLRALAAALALALLVALAQHFHLLALLARGAGLARTAGPLGALLVWLAIFFATSLLVPMVPQMMACGWIYGMSGALLSVPAATASAACAFLIGRALGRQRLQSLLSTRPRLRALADLAERGGIATVALIRISPILPFGPSNAVLGMTHLKLRDLIVGSFLGLLPGGLLYTAVGALLPDAAALERGEVPGRPFWAMLIVGALSLATMAVAATRKLRQSRSR